MTDDEHELPDPDEHLEASATEPKHTWAMVGCAATTIRTTSLRTCSASRANGASRGYFVAKQ